MYEKEAEWARWVLKMNYSPNHKALAKAFLDLLGVKDPPR
jgi:hypothetical protein